PFIPSRIKLSETCNYPERGRPDTLDSDSLDFLHRLWPGVSFAAGTKIDWNGDGKIGGDWILEGDECLVFFLGGIPDNRRGLPAGLGFAAEGRAPDAAEGARDGPFFIFLTYRLRDLHGRGFYSFLDPHGKQPYAFFSAYGKTNGYNRYGDTDCPALKVWPYAEQLQPTPRFLNPNSFQIISAGEDGKFGPGTDKPRNVWTPSTAHTMPRTGRDDLSNFYDRPLGQRQ